MRKNILGACVIFIVTVAILLMIDDIYKHKSTELDASAVQYDHSQQQDLATNDLEE